GRMRRFQGFDIGMSLSMPMRERRGWVETGDEFRVDDLVLDKVGDSFDAVNAKALPGEKEMKPLPKPGDWITFGGVYPAHPETKDPVRLFGLKTFKVVSVSDKTVTFTPRLVWAGPKQNAAGVQGKVFNVPMNKGTDGQHHYRWNVAFDSEAIAFVTADLALPKDVDFAHRSNHDGIGMRVVRKYDINEDRFPCRIDVLYGRKLLRPDSVCLLVGNRDD
ncbi:MAG: P22 phage major capsid protein family protein, partial [Candidatus Thiodiazotropha endolucinida]